MRKFWVASAVFAIFVTIFFSSGLAEKEWTEYQKSRLVGTQKDYKLTADQLERQREDDAALFGARITDCRKALKAVMKLVVKHRRLPRKAPVITPQSDWTPASDGAGSIVRYITLDGRDAIQTIEGGISFVPPVENRIWLNDVLIIVSMLVGVLMAHLIYQRK